MQNFPISKTDLLDQTKQPIKKHFALNPLVLFESSFLPTNRQLDLSDSQ